MKIPALSCVARAADRQTTYLYWDGRDTLYQIHGPNEPSPIGKAVSNGCIRMLNEHVSDLYERVDVGAEVVVR